MNLNDYKPEIEFKVILKKGEEYQEIFYTLKDIQRTKAEISMLKLAALQLKEVKTLYFDASYLDKNNLSEILKWAESEGLQLLIERPDFDAGNIRYEIISENFEEAKKEQETFF